jgi:hypothetical protein
LQVAALEQELQQPLPTYIALPHSTALVDTLRFVALTSSELALGYLRSKLQTKPQQVGSKRARRISPKPSSQHTEHTPDLAARDECAQDIPDRTVADAGTVQSNPTSVVSCTNDQVKEGMQWVAKCIALDVPAELTQAQLLAMLEAMHFLGMAVSLVLPAYVAPALKNICKSKVCNDVEDDSWRAAHMVKYHYINKMFPCIFYPVALLRRCIPCAGESKLRQAVDVLTWHGRVSIWLLSSPM